MDVQPIGDNSFDHVDLAIQIIDLHKRYGSFLGRSKVVLKGINLQCKSGQFYILYGTGSSGKSVIVKSILNIESFRHGVINLFNTNISNFNQRIGYMPQLQGVDKNLTIMETIYYFAVLQGIDKNECIENFSSLQSPMALSHYRILVADLNRDQKCILSFYIAMMSKPKLIVLDQPLAGCDPLYKNFLWRKLRSMVDNGTTVFMTCSDEIDMKYADVIGYLRNGQIITEESPDNLMKKYNISNFNDLVLSISLQELQTVSLIQTENTDVQSIYSGGFSITHFTDDHSQPHDNTKLQDFMMLDSKPPFSFAKEFNKFRTLVEWQVQIALRSYLRILYYLILPLACTIFYQYSVGNDISNVNLGIVHCRINDTANCLAMNKSICIIEDRVSEKYLNKFYYKDYDQADRDIRNGKLHAIFLLDGKSDDLNLRELDKKYGCHSNAFQSSNAVLEMDISSKLIRSHIIDQVARSYNPMRSDDYPLISGRNEFDSLNEQKCLFDCPVTPFILVLKDDFPGEYESEIFVLIWGAVAAITHFSGVLIGALPLCVQNRTGLLDRMIKIGVSHSELQLVHWTTRTFFIILQNLLILGCIIWSLNITTDASSFFISWFTIMLQSLCGFSFGILLFGVLRKRFAIIFYAVIAELIVCSISGFFWTYYSLAPFLRKLTVILPHFAVSKLLNRVIVHKMDVLQDDIWIAFLSPVFWMISMYVIYVILVVLSK